MNEGEILIAPFCSIDISNGQNIYDGGGKYHHEYSATVSKAPLQEILPEEELSGMQYLTEHASECYAMLNDLLNNKFTQEEFDLDRRIRNLKMAKREVAMGGYSYDIYHGYEEEIEQCEKKIEEAKAQNDAATEAVKKFKTIIRSICMSRCKAIEKEIDLDYENQKNKFIARKKDENLQRKIQQKNNIDKRVKSINQNHQSRIILS